MSFYFRRLLNKTSYGLNRFALEFNNTSGYIFGTIASIASIWLFQMHVYEIAGSSGPSMTPTIPDITNLIGVNKLYKKGRGIQVGDIIQFANPLIPKEFAGKRVIGLPGDYVLRSKKDSLTPGGAPLLGVTDWKMRLKGEPEQDWEEPEMIQVPQGHVWVEGDNLTWSRDSRTYGPVPMALIKGRSSWYADGWFSFASLDPGKGLYKVEEWEMDAVLGKEWLKSKERALLTQS